MNQYQGRYSIELSDSQQSAWQLASIQLAGWTSLPILATSVLILRENSFLGAGLTIILGNAILWFIRLGIIAMSYENRQSTLDVSRDYMGNFGNYFIAVLLLISTFSWFITQTTSSSGSLAQLIVFHEDPDVDQFIQISVFLGVVITIFCMGGIVLLRKLSVFCFPILIILFLGILYILPGDFEYTNNRSFSLSGLSLVLATNLGITADLPTFFRHSHSWKTSVKALLIIQLISLAFGLSSLYLGSIISTGFEINHETILSSGNIVFKSCIIGFLCLSVICSNVANVYSASVGWELIAPKALVGRKELFILGLGLTTIFILITGLFSVETLLTLSDSSLVNLTIVFLLGYIIRRQQKRLPAFFEQSTYFIAWLFATVMNILQIFGVIFSESSLIVTSFLIIFGCILLAFLGKNGYDFLSA